MLDKESPLAGGTAAGEDQIKILVPAEAHGSKSRAHWVAKIRQVTGKTVDGIIEIGQTLKAAKDALDHGEWMEIFEKNEVPYSLSVAERFIRVAKNKRLSNSANWQILPPVLSTLDDLRRLSDEEFEKCKADGTIHQGMVRKHINPNKPVSKKQWLLTAYESFVDDLERSLNAHEITTDDIRESPAHRKMMRLLG